MRSFIYKHDLIQTLQYFIIAFHCPMINPLSQQKSSKSSGVEAFRCRDFVKSLGYFYLASEGSPDDIEITEWKIKCFYELKEEEICLKNISKCEVMTHEIMVIECKVYLDRHDFAKIDQLTEKITSMENDTKFKAFLEEIRAISNAYKKYVSAKLKEEYEPATQYLSQLICRLPFNKNTTKLKLQQLQCLLKCGELNRAKTIIQSFSAEYINPELFFLRIRLFFYLQQEKQYKQLLQKCQSLFPNNQNVSKLQSMIDETQFDLKQGKLYIQYKKYDQAIKIFNEGLSIDPCNRLANSLLEFNKGIAYLRQKAYLDAKSCFNNAISLNPHNVDFRKERALFNVQQKDYVAAILDYEKLMDIDSANKDKYKKEIESLKKLDTANGKQDHYQMLNIEKDSTEDQIKKAYKTLAMKYHPDRNRAKSLAEIAENSYKFMQITEAYKVLADPEARRIYDHTQFFDSTEPSKQDISRKDQKNEDSSSSFSSCVRRDRTDPSDDESSEPRRSRDKEKSQKYSNTRDFNGKRGSYTQFNYNREYSRNGYSSFKGNNEFHNRNSQGKKSNANNRERTY